MNLVVIFGGESCEHDISIITGAQLISKCNSSLYNVIPIYISKQGIWYTGEKLSDIDNIYDNVKKSKECCFVPNSNYLFIKTGKKFKQFIKVDVAILCLHGRNGEDGTVASIMELSKIPYSSCGVLSSALCLDKGIFKDVCLGMDLPVVESFVLNENEYLLNKELYIEKIKQLGLPVIFKPCRLGSSIGIEVCKSLDEIDNKLSSAFCFDKKVLVEKYLDVEKEVNIAVMEDKGDLILSKTEEPISKDVILSFDDKYKNNAGGFETIKRISPANISDEIENQIKDMVVLCYSKFELFGVVRFDFIIDKNNKLYLNEVNTIPGSMANYLFDKELYPYPKLIEMMVSNAIHRFNKQKEIITTFDTDVLNDGFDGFKK